MTANVQEVVLKEPLRRIKSVGDITSGHSLEDYYCKNVMNVNKLSSRSLRTVDRKKLLQPTQEGSASILLTTRPDNTCTWSLIMQGRFLSNVQVRDPATKFKELPFTAQCSVVQVINTMRQLVGVHSRCHGPRSGLVISGD